MLLIDDARPSEAAQLAELLAELFTQEADLQVDRDKQLRGLEQIIGAPNVGRIFVAREDGRILGMVSLLFTISTAEGGPVCWLEDMIVRADERAAGVGSQLLAHAIEYAQSHGYTRITLLTDGSNVAAQRFYARHGFSNSDMRVMRLPLGELA